MVSLHKASLPTVNPILSQFPKLFDKTCETTLGENFDIGSVPALKKQILLGQCQAPEKSRRTMELLSKVFLSGVQLDMVQVIDEAGILRDCEVILPRHQPSLNFVDVLAYNLAPVNNDVSKVVSDKFDGKLPVSDPKLSSSKFMARSPAYAYVASVLWFVEQENTYNKMTEKLKKPRAIPKALQEFYESLKQFHTSLKQRLYSSILNENLGRWFYIRVLFKLLALVEVSLSYTDKIIIEAVQATCLSLDLEDPIGTTQTLSTNDFFKAVKFAHVIDLRDESEEEPEERSKKPEEGSEEESEEGSEEQPQLQLHQLQLQPKWRYSYEYEGTVMLFDLESSTCLDESCQKKIWFGGPYCLEHTKSTLHLDIITPKKEYKDGVYAYNSEAETEEELLEPVFDEGSYLLEEEFDTVQDVLFRKTMFGDIEEQGTNAYFPYSFLVFPEQKLWIDGSMNRHVLFMITRVSSLYQAANVTLEIIEESSSSSSSSLPGKVRVRLKVLKDIFYGEPLLLEDPTFEHKKNVVFSTFLDYRAAATVSMEVAKTVPEAVPEAVPETVSEPAAAAATVPESTVPQNDFMVAMLGGPKSQALQLYELNHPVDWDAVYAGVGLLE